MAIPDFQTLMLPLLQLFSDGKQWSLSKTVQKMAEHFNISEEELQQPLKTRGQTVFANRVSWAKCYLKQAQLISYPSRGVYAIAPRGQEVLKNPPTRIDIPFLMQFAEFREFRGKSAPAQQDVGAPALPEPQQCVEQTPQESIEKAYENITAMLESELLTQIMGCSAAFFESLVIDLLLAMGYGGSRAEAGQVVGRSGDGGIDGIIKEDRLGLDVIYVQAKRWSGSVGSPEIQKFAGALLGQSAKKGIFITTSHFTPEAKQYAASLQNTIVLIDGLALTKYMIEHCVGVDTAHTYVIKKIDYDYFNEE
jgi:restriction system protein